MLRAYILSLHGESCGETFIVLFLQNPDFFLPYFVEKSLRDTNFALL